MNPRRGELRGFGGDGKIAAGDKLAAGGSGGAGHLGNDRFRMCRNRRHQGRTLIQHAGEIVAATVSGVLRRAAGRCHFLQIVAGTEHRAVRRDHDHPHSIIAGGIIKCCGQRRHHGFGQGVARFRGVQRQAQNAVIITIGQHRRVIRRFTRSSGQHVTITHCSLLTCLDPGCPTG